ncbi:hypothetical protein NM208_g5818 [Fusarium decemcellulare]|uniref:Uncharacterized protein n=1 Tax=Fusarium decemcellulare TaxID=57161 RepID=A0ACC1SFH6_9HYPO|nr:hypothetical protein NM208_g5818 [Fusarium decemcellulare]
MADHNNMIIGDVSVATQQAANAYAAEFPIIFANNNRSRPIRYHDAFILSCETLLAATRTSPLPRSTTDFARRQLRELKKLVARQPTDEDPFIERIKSDKPLTRELLQLLAQTQPFTPR